MRTLRDEDASFEKRAIKVIRNTGTISAEPSAAWSVVADASTWTEWFPTVRASSYTTPEPHGLGSRRLIRLPGTRFIERIVAWEPAARWAFCVEQTTAPGLKALVETWAFAPTGTGTEITWTFAADVDTVGRLALAGAPVAMGPMFRRALRNLDRLAGPAQR